MADDSPNDAFDHYLADAERDPDFQAREKRRAARRERHPTRGFDLVIAVVFAIGVLAISVLYVRAAETPCQNVKGNISRKGDRIYHPPSSPSYGSVVIDPAKGERMFCSEADAVAAGWRPAKGNGAEGRPKRPQEMENPFR